MSIYKQQNGKTYLISGGGTELDKYISDVIDQKILEDNKKKYYVGKIIIDTKNINPSTYLGFGTWVLWGSGRVPVGVDTSQTEFNTVEKTGGEKTHKLTISEIASHPHTFTGNAHTHTLNNHTHSVPAHSHGLNNHKHSFSATTSNASAHTHVLTGGTENTNSSYYINSAVKGYDSSAVDIGTKTEPDGKHTHTVSGTTGASSGNTANSSALTTGASNINTSSSTATGSISNTGGDTPHNNLQPYITCYMWKRTA